MSTKQSKIDPLAYGIEVTTKVYVSIMIGIFPLFYLNNYINILEAKTIFFKVMTIAFIIIVSCLLLLALVQKKYTVITDKKNKMSKTDICAVGFAVVILISCILSPAGSEAFWGKEGRLLGGFVLLLCIGSYMIISRCFRPYQGLIWIFLAANAIQWILVILQFWDIDLLNMYENIDVTQRTSFLGTMGNVNFISGYTSVVLGILMAFYFQIEGKLSKICYGTAIGIGFCAAHATRSQSWILGIGAAAIILLWNGAEKAEKLKKLGEIWSIFLISSVLFQTTIQITEALGLSFKAVRDLKVDKLLTFILSWKVLLVQAICIFLWFLFVHKYQEKYSRLLKKIILMIGIIGAAAIIIMVFPLEDSYGSGRGYIWRVTIAEFSKLPILQKIFGYGPNCFFQFISPNRGEEMLQLFGNYFADAHNDLLQFLAVTGILGVISYFGMQISVLARCIKSRNKSTVLLAGVAGVAAYMAQGLVNNIQIVVIPLLFIFLAIMENIVRCKTDDSELNKN